MSPKYLFGEDLELIVVRHLRDELRRRITCTAVYLRLFFRPMINGKYQKMGKCYRATDFSFTENDAVTGFRCDFAAAYELPSLYRSLQFKKATGNLTVEDRFMFTQNESVTERFVTFVDPHIENGFAVIENSTGKTAAICIALTVLYCPFFLLKQAE